MESIFTFWEGPMPDYIRMCMKTWKFPYTLLNYENLSEYTSFDIEAAKRFTLPQIADIVRVHVLRDQGGYWLDTDTICLSDKLPVEHMVGNPVTKSNTIGFLHTEKNSEMYKQWAQYQDDIIKSVHTPLLWSIMGNSFTDNYLAEHDEISIAPVLKRWPETYMNISDVPRCTKYRWFYFECDFHLWDLEKTDMLMLHNSWTPDWYKKLAADAVLKTQCTLSNIFREVLECG